MITLDNFEAIVPFKILMRGQEYYELGAVSDLEEASSGEWTATVDGTRSYTVEISLEGDKVDSWYCDCPYDGGICKHVVATLFAIRDNSEKVSRSVFSKMSVLEDDGDEEMDVEESVDLERIEDTVLYSPVFLLLSLRNFHGLYVNMLLRIRNLKQPCWTGLLRKNCQRLPKIKITEKKFKRYLRTPFRVRNRAIIIVMMTLAVIGKLFSVNWILFWRKQISS